MIFIVINGVKAETNKNTILMYVCRIIITQKSGATKDRRGKLTVFNKKMNNLGFLGHQSRPPFWLWRACATLRVR